MSQFLFVCAGGAVGSGARYVFASWAQRTWGAGFPYGTLSVNLLGSFLILVVMELGAQKAVLSADVRLFLSTGVMGGFTTYSAFSHETLRLFEQRAFGTGVTYVLTTVFGCVVAAGLGLFAGRWLGGVLSS